MFNLPNQSFKGTSSQALYDAYQIASNIFNKSNNSLYPENQSETIQTSLRTLTHFDLAESPPLIHQG